jgi:c-di-GMP-binding flagellar brake protein YcgR
MATLGAGPSASWVVPRRYERVAFYSPVMAWAFAGGAKHESRSVDISLGGVRIVTSLSASPGELLWLRFEVKENGRSVLEEVAGRVVRVVADDRLNALGIEFLEPLTESRQPALVRRIREL